MGSKIFCGIRDQNFHPIWDQGSKFWVKKMGSVMKNIPRYDPVICTPLIGVARYVLTYYFNDVAGHVAIVSFPFRIN